MEITEAILREVQVMTEQNAQLLAKVDELHMQVRDLKQRMPVPELLTMAEVKDRLHIKSSRTVMDLIKRGHLILPGKVRGRGHRVLITYESVLKYENSNIIHKPKINN